jgi:hypothetical protein
MIFWTDDLLTDSRRKHPGGTTVVVCLALVGWLLAGGTAPSLAVGKDFAAAKPILARYCLDCHSGDAAEGEVNLSFTHDAATLGKHAKLLQRVEDMVTSGQMPPPESDQPTDEERRVLADWLQAFLLAEARAHAGDPGRVVLRRLNNAEYTHTIRDLTGVDGLDPAKEFPADGGAGEGFTNTGQSLAMSPSLAAKYLDAAKGIAAHAVLLPDGVAFSAGDSRRDFADDWIARVKTFYARHTQPLDTQAAQEQSTVKQGIQLDMGTEGFLPVESYVAATLELRDHPAVGPPVIAALARDRGLSPKYLAAVWQMLSVTDPASPLLEHVRGLWRSAALGDAKRLATEIGGWQNALWKFNAVGNISRHLGRLDGPTRWQEEKSPLVREQEFRVKIPPPAPGDTSPTVTLHLAAGDAGDGAADDVAVFRAPRLVASGRVDVPLVHVRASAAALVAWQTKLAATAAAALAAADEAQAAGPHASFPETTATLAAKHGVDARLLANWFALVGLGTEPAALDTLLTDKLTKGGGWDSISGWKGPQDLSVLANASADQEVQIPQTMPPRAIVVHPGKDRRVVVAWRSPIAGPVRIEAAVRSAHPVCGQGIVWHLEVRRGRSRQSLATAEFEKSKERLPIGLFDSVAVREGDMITLAIGSRAGDNSCDSTLIELKITATGDGSADKTRPWDLAADCSADILAANPHPDAHGRANVWHFGSEPDAPGSDSVIPVDSALARWLVSTADGDRAASAGRIATLVAAPPADPTDASPDAALARMLRAPSGPLLGRLIHDVVQAGEVQVDPDTATVGLDPALFGRHPAVPSAGTVASADLCFRPPQAFTITLPRDFADGCEFVTTAAVAPGAGPQASIQPFVGVGPAPGTALSAAALIMAAEASPAWERFTRGIDLFRGVFPKALCYGRIVPVDEVIPLNLYFREDDHLRRLLLDDAEAAELDRLWDELLFVAREPEELQDAFEQLQGYASQDRPDLVAAFKPMIPVIAARAEDFTRRLVEAEPRHVDAVVAFAGRAFRRPLVPREEARLRSLYDTLRKKEVPHEEAIRAVLAHVLVSADFLYKIETAGPGADPKPVSDYELATRLSYFLWSSMPDAELLAAAESGRLHEPEVLKSQVRRMLAAPASRRLAEEFGTQWLHVHGFSSLDEKNAELFPTFADLRADMEEETVLFLDDFFRNDRSILALVDADHTFLNERLAKHYAIEGVTGDDWRRVEGMREHGRGSILCLATTLSTQAGASRTSPILRGNWLYETILGEKLPKPPKDVPLLAETVPTGLSERQLIAMHSENAACAKCHRRIDPFGFALEEFDAIGRLRTADASGKPLDTKAVLPDGVTLDGQESVRAYLLGPRREQFVRVFCRKLLGYALGRGVQLSDQPLLDEMAARLAASEYRISVAIEAIVTSPQFLSIRGRDAADDAT